MRLKLVFSEDVKILLKLYDIHKGTLMEISNHVGKSYTSGKIYKIKDDLIKLRVLEPTNETKTINLGRGEKETKVFKINHDVIDQIFCGELETAKIYNRVTGGYISIMFPKIKRKGILDELA